MNSNFLSLLFAVLCSINQFAYALPTKQLDLEAGCDTAQVPNLQTTAEVGKELEADLQPALRLFKPQDQLPLTKSKLTYLDGCFSQFIVDSFQINLAKGTVPGLAESKIIQATLVQYFADRRVRHSTFAKEDLAEMLGPISPNKSVLHHLGKTPPSSLSISSEDKECSKEVQDHWNNWLNSFSTQQQDHSAKVSPPIHPVPSITLEELRAQSKGINFENSGQSGSQVFPIQDSDGNKSYVKYDVPSGPEKNKLAEDERKREIAAFRLDRKLGLNLIPDEKVVNITQLPNGKNALATIQKAVPPGFTQWKSPDDLPADVAEQVYDHISKSPHFMEMRALDYLINHRDRHAGNFFIEGEPFSEAPNKKLFLIDNGGGGSTPSFGQKLQQYRENPKLPGVQSGKLSGLNLPEYYPPQLKNALIGFKFKDLEDSMDGLEKKDIEGAWLRLLILKSHITHLDAPVKD